MTKMMDPMRQQRRVQAFPERLNVPDVRQVVYSPTVDEISSAKPLLSKQATSNLRSHAVKPVPVERIDIAAYTLHTGRSKKSGVEVMIKPDNEDPPCARWM
jgi:hypothetical protein